MYPNLRAELSRRGLTIQNLALLCGMSASALYERLKGRRHLTLDDALKIKKALNVDIPLEILFSQEIAS